jgi:regulator of protease activity HflC (stomatin/prohibitin superfamily)
MNGVIAMSSIVGNAAAGPASGKGAGRMAGAASGLRRWLKYGFIALLVLWAVGACYFTIAPNERGYVTVFGRVANPAAGPLQPGLHFKWPFVASVDRISVSIDVVDIGNIEAFTKDAQKITVHVTVTTQVPDSAVYHLLYDVGRAGNVDLEKNYQTIIADRLRTVVGRHDINEIAGEQRQQIIDEVRSVLSRDLTDLFGIKVDSVQSALVGMPPSYAAAIEAAMQARTQRQAAEQNQARAQIEAVTAKVRAGGEADAKIEEARGESQSQLLRASAEAQATRLKGQAEADASEALAKALETNANLVALRTAERWNGVLPQNIYAGAPIPFLQMPGQR